MTLSPATERALRGAVLQVAEAQRRRADAMAAAHRAGAAIPEIARAVGMDAFAVRDVLVAVGELEALRPKEAVWRP